MYGAIATTHVPRAHMRATPHTTGTSYHYECDPGSLRMHALPEDCPTTITKGCLVNPRPSCGKIIIGAWPRSVAMSAPQKAPHSPGPCNRDKRIDRCAPRMRPILTRTNTWCQPSSLCTRRTTLSICCTACLERHAFHGTYCMSNSVTRLQHDNRPHTDPPRVLLLPLGLAPGLKCVLKITFSMSWSSSTNSHFEPVCPSASVFTGSSVGPDGAAATRYASMQGRCSSPDLAARPCGSSMRRRGTSREHKGGAVRPVDGNRFVGCV